jgi:hypothetical protein
VSARRTQGRLSVVNSICSFGHQNGRPTPPSGGPPSLASLAIAENSSHSRIVAISSLRLKCCKSGDPRLGRLASSRRRRLRAQLPRRRNLSPRPSRFKDQSKCNWRPSERPANEHIYEWRWRWCVRSRAKPADSLRLPGLGTFCSLCLVLRHSGLKNDFVFRSALRLAKGRERRAQLNFGLLDEARMFSPPVAATAFTRLECLPG